MMGKLTFVTYDEQYLEQVTRTYNHYVAHTTVSYDLELYTTEQMRQLIEPASELYRSYVIMDDGEYAGYVLITQHKKKAAFKVTGEVTIYLEPTSTGRGIGKAAIPFIEQIAKEQGMHSLVASICSSNEGSLRIFANHGYEQVAHYKEVAYKFDRWLDLICLQKFI
ncbi:phosphinothricin acetyltransferase [Paenibacillus phyllosphaerae]|uniref:Phosphinothricin acetyltransferase n=1 Tax=Paenibacillus phyllosphaerae TaxID=274593 RepID=A0A7W5AWA8_9BACL|nr:GNAT family N-acetyltransferase [Paenibacillus phyllosphaerae]MBB3109998.1 phosphinothricin acetyltransferase [Paenibacillus phyllosphaerae]